jgi:SAM-dependent methyltransferase
MKIRDYDRVAEAYAERFSDELSHKPLDRALLCAVADELRGRGVVADLGCGPGHVAALLAAQGVTALGVDLSPAMIAEARRRVPGVAFSVGDLRALEVVDGAWAGAVAFYSIVHFTAEELPPVFGELRRAIAPGGPLLVSFHVGDERVHLDEFFGAPVDLDWFFHPRATVERALAAAGFSVEVSLERVAYESEHPSRRGYLLAR